MMYVLDTNVVSELRKIQVGKADSNVAAWTQSVDASELFVSAITIMELELGVLSIERKDITQGTLLRIWMEQHVLPEFSERTLPVDTVVALRCAQLHVPDRCHERDALIAATALVHGMAVVTRNVADFQPTGVTILNPWEWRSHACNENGNQ
ncbi:type II toxin-antitoxin system VapC family toxin [Xylella fastidiosa]|uniref:type II toxin-antitoxin system VapC family toxin n=1 Tax=Xylella fastidiosa TaxID=2371 RepID=UPI0019D446E3|nr:type II toxin-antitoxin system VapC family toxin [Xylella fastidiosa]